jgi:hypothetical protein
MAIKRQVKESENGPIPQGVNEIIAYYFKTTPWGSAPSAPSAVVKDMTAGAADVTASVMPGAAPQVAGDVITLRPLRGLTLDHQYRVDVVFTVSGNVEGTFFTVAAEL